MLVTEMISNLKTQRYNNLGYNNNGKEWYLTTLLMVVYLNLEKSNLIKKIW